MVHSRLGTRIYAAPCSWRGSVCLAPVRRASLQHLGASQHSVGPQVAVAGARGSAFLRVQAKQEPPVQQGQRQPQPEPSSWLHSCERVAAFQRQHGRLPRASADTQGPLLPHEQSLVLWCTEQQRRKAGSKGPPLSGDERSALQGIPGWVWWATKRVTKPWEQRRQEVEAFHQQHGRLPRTRAGQSCPFLPGEEELGRWIATQRSCFRGRKQPPLSAERVAALECIPGWSWGEKPWDQRREEVEAFYQQHGRLPRISAGQSCPFLPDEEGLGAWIKTQRRCFRGHMQPPLSAERIAALERIPGWSWGYTMEPWGVRYQQVQDFVRQHGRIPRQQGSKSMPLQPSEKELGVWCRLQRQRRKGSTEHSLPLTAEQHAALAAIPGWVLGVDERWEQRWQQLEAFVRQHGRMPRRRASLENPLLEGEQVLGAWRTHQKEKERGVGRRSPLTAEQLAALQSIPLW